MDSSRSSPMNSFVQDANGADEVSVAQIANARETFDDLESAYRKFKFELESVKGEHKSEVRNSFFSLHSAFFRKTSKVSQQCIVSQLY